jgi:hypothetical protein
VVSVIRISRILGPSSLYSSKKRAKDIDAYLFDSILKSFPSKGIIVDLRANGGGHAAICWQKVYKMPNSWYKSTKVRRLQSVFSITTNCNYPK